tara:strand:+ start:732 stop:1040 length:309 start_codon:yes stop_codon:yes gene_type:complete
VWRPQTENGQWRGKWTPHFNINRFYYKEGIMPAKFKPSQKVYKRGVPAANLPVQHFYLKNTPKEELFAEINKSSVKPKQRQKCLNELARRGIQVQWVSKESA